ncbi:unnamed protein product [Notodromas monacha]|uniref:Peptidase S1 domain-containing protein n=1 Tax=Notodromas monacha TaxID=399045 RepID=A0A7R9BIM3_9CRUS|nr:unnamed protein product [Notodromas monacha]CAG0916206.1 unnamed protein product [Notodromas monacha]
MLGYQMSDMKHYQHVSQPFTGFGPVGVQSAHFYFSSAMNVLGNPPNSISPDVSPSEVHLKNFEPSKTSHITNAEEEEEPPPPGLITPPMSPKPGSLNDDGIPKELADMQMPDACELCSVLLSSKMKADLHYACSTHERRMKRFMIKYCQSHRLSLPEKFRTKASHKNSPNSQKRCKICQVSFEDDVDADKHFANICHNRRLDGKPLLKTGFYNKLTGKWQKNMESKKTITDHHRVNLFTPGPLNVSEQVKKAMLVDYGSREDAFIGIVSTVRRKLLEVAGLSEGEYSCILLQGSGSYGLEAVLQTFVPANGRVLTLVNGDYGRRVVKMCEMMKTDVDKIVIPDNEAFSVSIIEEYFTPNFQKLKKDDQFEMKASYDLISVQHCETTHGVMNEIHELGPILKNKFPGALIMIDAASSFGGTKLSMQDSCADFVVSSSNKCLEGVPGLAIIFARNRALASHAGISRSYSMDLVDQLNYLDKTGQFRFTPPIQCILAMMEAVNQLVKEGGVSGRAKRYEKSCSFTRKEMQNMGFQLFLRPEIRCDFISSFLVPEIEGFNLAEFTHKLAQRGQIIYRGTSKSVQTFRIGHIGDIYQENCEELISSMKDVLTEMNLKIPIFNDLVGGIQLPTSSLNLRDQTPLMVFGVDSSGLDVRKERKKIKEASATIVFAMSSTDCLQEFQDAQVPLQYFPQFICTSGGFLRGRSCHGDRGSALITISEVTGQAGLVGLLTWMAACESPGFPGVFTKLSHYSDWINRQIQEIKNPSTARTKVKLSSMI